MYLLDYRYVHVTVVLNNMILGFTKIRFQMDQSLSQCDEHTGDIL